MMLAVGTSLAIIIPTSIRSAGTHYSKKNMDLGVVRLYLWAVPLGGFGWAIFCQGGLWFCFNRDFWVYRHFAGPLYADHWQRISPVIWGA